MFSSCLFWLALSLATPSPSLGLHVGTKASMWSRVYNGSSLSSRRNNHTWAFGTGSAVRVARSWGNISARNLLGKRIVATARSWGNISARNLLGKRIATETVGFLQVSAAHFAGIVGFSFFWFKLLVLTAIAIAVLIIWREMRTSSIEASHLSVIPKASSVKHVIGDHELQGTIGPGGLVRSNANESTRFENENCTGSFLMLHRPTHNPAVNESGQYPHAAHFSGTDKLWEVRLQLNFKETPSSPIVFGFELDDYVPVSSATKLLMNLIISILRRVDPDIYHSVGDDPKVCKGSPETPVLVMPLWTFDQFIVTAEGEQAPNLADPRFAELGKKRLDDPASFSKEILDLKSGPTYTFAYWGISKNLDLINWEICGLPTTNINFNQICGNPPVKVVMYSIQGPGSSNEAHEARHLQARKQYFFQLSFWSTKCKPSKERMEELLYGGMKKKRLRFTEDPDLPPPTTSLETDNSRKTQSSTGAQVGRLLSGLCARWTAAP